MRITCTSKKIYCVSLLLALLVWVPEGYSLNFSIAKNPGALQTGIYNQNTYNTSNAISNIFNYQPTVGGTLSGTAQGSGSDWVSAGFVFGAAYTKKIAGHDYGQWVDLGFGLQPRSVNYSYSVPYTTGFTFPTTVFPGQRVVLDTTPSYGSSVSLSSSQNVGYWSTLQFQMDAPGDGLDDTRLTNVITNDRFPLSLINGTVNTSGAIPMVPGLSSVSFPSVPGPFPAEITIPDLGLEVRTAGTVNSVISGASANPASRYVDPDSGSLYIVNGGTSNQGQRISGDQLTALGIGLDEAAGATANPYLAGAATIVHALDGIFDVDTNLTMSINRSDSLFVQLSEIPYVDIPSLASLGGTYGLHSLTLPVTVNFSVTPYSYYWFDYSMSLVLDSAFTSEWQVYNNNLGSISLGYLAGPTQLISQTFNITVNDVNVSNAFSAFQPISLADLLMNYNFSDLYGSYVPANPTGIALADLNTLYKTEVEPVPEPGTIILLGSGLLGLAGYGRGRLKK